MPRGHVDLDAEVHVEMQREALASSMVVLLRRSLGLLEKAELWRVAIAPDLVGSLLSHVDAFQALADPASMHPLFA